MRRLQRVWVEAPGRLHLGILDLSGSLGRWFGGIGTAAPVPPLRLWAEPASPGSVQVTGDDSLRARAFATRFLGAHQHGGGIHLHVERALPRHVGLGSGTQLALAVARAIAEVYSLECDVQHLAAATGRTRRSGVGMWVFDGGGLVVEGGRRGRESAPLLTRLPFPASWRVVVAIPQSPETVSGRGEEEAFDAIPTPPLADVQLVAHHVLMGLLPSLVDGDLPGFGAALTTIQRTTGNWFAQQQGGPFGRGSQTLVDAFLTLGGQGVGQSSWGPCTYAFVQDEAAADQLIRAMRDHVGPLDLYAGALRRDGARVWT